MGHKVGQEEVTEGDIRDRGGEDQEGEEGMYMEGEVLEVAWRS